jgi:hypothetical protein
MIIKILKSNFSDTKTEHEEELIISWKSLILNYELVKALSAFLLHVFLKAFFHSLIIIPKHDSSRKYVSYLNLNHVNTIFCSFMYAGNVYTKIFSIIALKHDLNDTQIGICMFHFLNERTRANVFSLCLNKPS